MAEIQRSRLEKAERDLRSIADRHSGAFRNRDIDWQVISQQLCRLQIALKDENESSFAEALRKLVTRLAPPLDLRGEIHAWKKDKARAMPPPVFELLNKTIEQLHVDLTPVSEEDKKEQVGDQQDRRRAIL